LSGQYSSVPLVDIFTVFLLVDINNVLLIYLAFLPFGGESSRRAQGAGNCIEVISIDSPAARSGGIISMGGNRSVAYFVMLQDSTHKPDRVMFPVMTLHHCGADNPFIRKQHNVDWGSGAPILLAP
jgi:hypothetical protein